MGEALYRKYRPKKLDDVVGQPHITTTLTNAIKDGRISHGYLFSGPRGVGKTSVARILAHQVNNFEYGDSQGALDIIEIDAASNRRIDEIRDLRDKIHTAPVAGQYKVYIIDEVHMLTREAFNALLKTLEEPPAHVIFILATTEAHKLPETIVSRTQRYTFKAVPQKAVTEHLRQLAQQENIRISNEALELIAEHGEGSFRDSISLLDQLSSHNDIDAAAVRGLLGMPPTELVDDIFTSIKAHEITKLIPRLEEAFTQGLSPNRIAIALIDKIRSRLATDTNPAMIELAQQLLQTSAASDPGRYLELTLSEHAFSPVNQTAANNDIVVPPSEKQQPKEDKPQIKKLVTTETSPKNKAKTNNSADQPRISPRQEQSLETVKDLDKLLEQGVWEKLLAQLRKKYNTLYGLARMAQPTTEDNILMLKVPYIFHQKRLSEEKNAEIIRATLIELIGSPVTIKVEVAELHQKVAKTPDSQDSSDTLDAVTKIFGGGEVLET